MRAVFDPNVLISATLSPAGSPAKALRRWLGGAFELVCSQGLLDELSRAFEYPKLAQRVSRAEATEFVDLLARSSIFVDDPEGPPPTASPDPDDDYLIALAAATRSILVSGDNDLLGLTGQIPVYSPAGFLDLLASES